jgi:hypothetical protein
LSWYTAEEDSQDFLKRKEILRCIESSNPDIKVYRGVYDSVVGFAGSDSTLDQNTILSSIIIGMMVLPFILLGLAKCAEKFKPADNIEDNCKNV